MPVDSIATAPRVPGESTLATFPLRRRLWPLACFLGIALSGCVVIPTPEHGLLQGRGEIRATDIAFLEAAKTSREEVLLRFGEPDRILGRDRILVYHWAVSHGYWFVGGAYTANGGPITKEYLLMMEFDARGILQRFELAGSVLWSPQHMIDRWAEPDTAPAPREIVIPPAPAEPHGKEWKVFREPRR